MLRPSFAAAAVLLALPAGASAAPQTTAVQATCKFPYVGAKPITVRVTVGLPDFLEPDGTTGPFPVSVALDGSQITDTIWARYEDAGSFSGSYKLGLSYRQSTRVFATDSVDLTLPPTQVSAPAELAWKDLVASGTASSVSVAGVLEGKVAVDTLEVNLRLRNYEDRPETLAPVETDLDGNPVTDSDGDPTTYDVYCKLPTPPRVVAQLKFGPRPTPVPTPEPTPSPVPTPLPTAPMPEVPSEAAVEPYQCKWPLAGISDVQVSSVFADPAAGAPVPFELWMQNQGPDVYATTVDDLAGYGGSINAVIEATTPSGPVVFTTPAAIDTYAFATTGAPGTPSFHAAGSIPAFQLPAGTTSVRLVNVQPLLRLLDAQGDSILLPPLTKPIPGGTLPPAYGDGQTGLSCLPTSAPTPTPTPEVTPEVTPTPTGSPTPPPSPVPMPQVPPAAVIEPYQCKWPLLGVLDARVSSVFADPAAGAPVPFELWLQNTGADGYATTVDDLAGYAGSIGAVVEATTPSGPVVLEVASTIDTYLAGQTGLPGTPFFHATGSIPAAQLPAGTTALRLLNVKPVIRLLDAQGAPIILPRLTSAIPGGTVPRTDGPEEVGISCAPTPTPTVTATPKPGATPTPVVTPTPAATPKPQTAQMRYALQGSTRLNTLTRGAMPLTGGVAAQLALATGDVTADLTLNDTQGRLTVLGFLPVTATVGFVPSGQTTGKLTDDRLETHSKVRIKVKSVKAFGAIPLVSGNSCQSKQLSDIALASTGPFDPVSGGALAGTYAISDLNGCGPLDGLVSPLTAGSGNTINVTLSGSAAATS